PRIAGDFVTFENHPAPTSPGPFGGDILLYQFSTNRLWNVSQTWQAGLNAELDDVSVLPGGDLLVVYDSDESGASQRAVHAVRFTVPSTADQTPPDVTITSPANGSLYPLNALATAQYSCSDAGSGVASCQGPVANGAAIPTASAGPQTFTVNARDVAGNSASRTTTYTVSFGVYPLYDASKAKKSGSTYPIQIQLCDGAGRNVSAAAIVVHATGVTQLSTNAPGVLADAGNSNPDFDFRYDAASASYIFNLQTTGYATGTYALNFVAGIDPATHAALFQVR
ncbi:MAG: PxKF domain-containing protein, partial [Proteobacteria bacterium]|nr:PxKF domain-containing protein [Pseudomonadota bacterium]